MFKFNALFTVDAKFCVSAQQVAGSVFPPLSLSGHFLSNIVANPLLEIFLFFLSRRSPILAFIINCIAGRVQMCGLL